MKIRKRALTIALACLMLTGALTGFSSTAAATSSKKVTITFWHTFSDTEQKVFKQYVIPNYTKTHPNVTINAVAYPTSSFKQNLIQSIAGKSGPDVVRTDIQWVSQLASLGGLVDVSKLSNFKAAKSASIKATMDTCLWNGKYYGLPYDTNTKVAIYNTSALKAAGLSGAPTTFDKLLTAAIKLKKTHTSGLIAIGGTSIWSMGAYYLSLGGQYCNKSYTKATGFINSPKSIAALSKLVSAYGQGLLGKCLLGGQPSTWDGLKATDNSYLMCDEGPWFFSLQNKTVTSKDTVALMPAGSGGSVSLVGGEDIVMTKNCKNQKETWEFMKYLSTATYPQQTMALKADCLPTCSKVADSAAVTKDPIRKIYMKQLKTAWARIPNQHYEEMDTDIKMAFEKAFRGQGTVKTILNDLATQLDALFANSSGYSS